MSSGSSLRSSSASSSEVSRRFSATARSGWPSMQSVASEPSGRSSTISPWSVCIRTAVRPGPDEMERVTGTSSRSASHIASSSQLGLNSSPSTSAPFTRLGTWSSAAASIERQGVMRDHARSVSPGV